MNVLEAMQARHSVRSYTDKPIEGETLAALTAAIDEANRESDLHIQLVQNEPKAFDSTMAHYGKFSGVKNYIAMIGKKGPELEEKCGYYGEKLVLLAQTLGLNTCWVAMTYKKIPSAFTVDAGEKLVIVIAIGYGAAQGAAHKSKNLSEVSKAAYVPDWFKSGMEAALLAPTAVNQQKFLIELDGDKVSARVNGLGVCTKIDLGIVKYHFEVGSGKGPEIWK